ncbi:hypothetical protein PR003_g15021 [Phytophthora rubi]|uniref:Uncharacterized protein n=1 Tax=Phytophthora rubi TaxID=129364 RepID=A0A6A4F378_9STRA|nr:hypothetical protein PR002_g14417 [Phytophthora rubi]KAE9331406.1 hypothetical protein PR003_g15021 [Phytophthora rubi]
MTGLLGCRQVATAVFRCQARPSLGHNLGTAKYGYQACENTCDANLHP